MSSMQEEGQKSKKKQTIDDSYEKGQSSQPPQHAGGEKGLTRESGPSRHGEHPSVPGAEISDLARWKGAGIEAESHLKEIRDDPQAGKSIHDFSYKDALQGDVPEKKERGVSLSDQQLGGKSRKGGQQQQQGFDEQGFNEQGFDEEEAGQGLDEIAKDKGLQYKSGGTDDQSLKAGQQRGGKQQRGLDEDVAQEGADEGIDETAQSDDAPIGHSVKFDEQQDELQEGGFEKMEKSDKTDKTHKAKTHKGKTGKAKETAGDDEEEEADELKEQLKSKKLDKTSDKKDKAQYKAKETAGDDDEEEEADEPKQQLKSKKLDKTSDKKDKIERKAKEAGSDAEDAADETKKKLKNKKDDLVEKASDKADETIDDAADAQETVKEKATAAKDWVVEKATDAKEAVKEGLGMQTDDQQSGIEDFDAQQAIGEKGAEPQDSAKFASDDQALDRIKGLGLDDTKQAFLGKQIANRLFFFSFSYFIFVGKQIPDLSGLKAMQDESSSRH
jgi:hypothetical protein